MDLAGTTSQTINVPVIGDTLSESNETFFVNLTRAVNANIVAAQGTGTILDDDALPALTIADARGTELDAGARNMTFNVRLSVPSGRTVTVNYATADGSAVAGSGSDQSRARPTCSMVQSVTAQSRAP